jgi:hypothetical protein
VTLTTLTVEDTIKGHPPATVVVEQMGGTVGDIRVWVAGTALFRPQESYMLFLEPSTGSSRYLLVGMVQGSYHIFRDPLAQEERVSLPLNRLLLGSGKELRTSGGLLPLKEFREDLSAAMKAPVVIPRGTAIPVTIQSVESRGVARVRVLGQTTAEVFPAPTVVIPAGSPLEGTAERVSGKWRIHWTEVSIRGQRGAISATSQEPADSTLRGRTLVITVR